MRAVNLIPADQQRGAGGAAGKSGGAVYALLGGLALLVVLAGLFVTSKKSVDDKRAQLTSVTAQATAAEAQATSLASYTKFAAIRAKRVDTVRQLTASRFDWAHAFREVARVLPDNAWVTAMTATTSPSVTLSGGSTGQLRGAISSPAIVLQGCTTSQASVSKVLARLRLADGVQRVSLEDATKGQSSGGAAATGGGSSGDCRGGHANYPQFNVDIWFNAPSTTVASTTSSTGTATTAADTTAATSATPATTAAPASTSTAPSTTGGTSK